MEGAAGQPGHRGQKQQTDKSIAEFSQKKFQSSGAGVVFLGFGFLTVKCSMPKATLKAWFEIRISHHAGPHETSTLNVQCSMFDVRILFLQPHPF